MSDSVNIQEKLSRLDISPQHDGFTKVEMLIDEETSVTAGADTGRTLTVDCPWGTQVIANNILKSIRGYRYQPMRISDALLDPAAELMDGITADGVYGGIYGLNINFGPQYSASIESPQDEEIDHEYPYIPKEDRKVHRQLAGMSSELRIHADQISAKVEKIGGSLGPSGSFSWEMAYNHHIWKANGREIARLDATGLAIEGEIRARSGEIGGFQILRDRLSYNNQDWGGSNSRGCYLGPNGLQLGSWGSGFHVDSYGNLYANNGEFRGSVRAGMIEYGGNAGYFNGGGISTGSISGGWGGQIGDGTITTDNTSRGINTSLGYADFADDVFNDRDEAYIGNFKYLRIYGSLAQWASIAFEDGTGHTISLSYLTKV